MASFVYSDEPNVERAQKLSFFVAVIMAKHSSRSFKRTFEPWCKWCRLINLTIGTSASASGIFLPARPYPPLMKKWRVRALYAEFAALKQGLVYSVGRTSPGPTAPAAWDVPALFCGKALPPAQFSSFLIGGLLLNYRARQKGVGQVW